MEEEILAFIDVPDYEPYAVRSRKQEFLQQYLALLQEEEYEWIKED